MTYKKLGFIFGGLFLIILIANFMVSRSSEKTEEVVPQKPTAKNIVPQPNKDKTLKRREWKKTDPKDLAKYGITVTPKLLEPSTSEGWEEYVESTLDESKVLETERGKEAVTTMQINREEYEKNMKTVDEHVEVIKKRINEDPFNKKHKEQLQNIYKIKAVGKALEKHVVVEEDKFISNTLKPVTEE